MIRVINITSSTSRNTFHSINGSYNAPNAPIQAEISIELDSNDAKVMSIEELEMRLNKGYAGYEPIDGAPSYLWYVKKYNPELLL